MTGGDFRGRESAAKLQQTLPNDEDEKMSSKRKPSKIQKRTKKTPRPSQLTSINNLPEQTTLLATLLAFCTAMTIIGAALLRFAQEIFDLMPGIAQLFGFVFVLLGLGLAPVFAGRFTEKVLPARWWRLPVGLMIVIGSSFFVQAGVYTGVQQLPAAASLVLKH